MAYSCLVVIENVLSTDAPTLAQAQSIPEGLMLMRGLKSVFRISLSTMEPEPETAERFLMFAGVHTNEYDRLLWPLEGESPAKAMRRHINLSRQTGDLAYVVTADPTTAKRCLNIGVTPLLCPHPEYAAPSFLPTAGEGGQAWADMIDVLTEQKFLRASDLRADDSADVE